MTTVYNNGVTDWHRSGTNRGYYSPPKKKMMDQLREMVHKKEGKSIKSLLKPEIKEKPAQHTPIYKERLANLPENGVPLEFSFVAKEGGKLLQQAEEAIIRKMMAHTSNIALTARVLGVSQKTIYSKLEQYRIERRTMF